MPSWRGYLIKLEIGQASQQPKRLPSVCGLNEGDNEAFGERKRTSDGVMMAILPGSLRALWDKRCSLLMRFNQRFNVRILVVCLCTVHNNNMCVIQPAQESTPYMSRAERELNAHRLAVHPDTAPKKRMCS